MHSRMQTALDTESRRGVMTDINSSTAKLVFQSLALEGAATVSQLQHRLALPKLTILSVLKTLSRDGLVDTKSTSERTRYYARE